MAEGDVNDASQGETEDDYGRPTAELDSDALLLRFKDWWRQDLPRAKSWHTTAAEEFEFRSGDQWPDDEKETMQTAQQRACLEFNQVDPVIDAVAGSEITNRQEVRFIPRQVGMGAPNEVLTEAARWFRDECDAEDEESAAFADAATAGMGWTETRLDYECNPDGDPVIERVDPLEMVWDGASKKANLVDARRVMRVKSELPLSEAREKWPQDCDGNPIVDDSDYDATWASDITEAREETPYEVHFPGEPLRHESEGAREDRTVTVVQIQWYENEDFYRGIMMHPETGQPHMAELTPDQHMIAMNRADEIGAAYRGVQQTRRIYYKAFVGGRVLEVTKMVGPSGKPAASFSLNCITAKWDRGKSVFYGLVRAMKGPQIYANKWLSTTVEMLSRGAKGGLMLEEGAVVDVQDFEDQWSTPGSNAYFRQGAITGGKVQPKPQTQFPQDFMSMTQFAISSIRDVTGVNVEQLGLASGTPSGGPDTASQEYQRRQSATVILAPLFNSLRRYRKIQGRFLLWQITEFLSDGRLVRIVGEEGDRWVPLIHDQNVLDYSVIVDDAPSSPSQKELVWNSLVTMLPLIQSIQPPPQVIMALLEYSPLPSSVVAKIKQAVAEFAQSQQQNPQPNPMQLIMMQKQQDVQAEKEKNAIKLQSKQAEQSLDLVHQREAAKIDLQSKIEMARVASWAKVHDAQTQAAATPTAPHPMDAAVQEGIAQGVKAGVTQIATQIAASQFGGGENVTGTPGQEKPAEKPAPDHSATILELVKHVTRPKPRVAGLRRTPEGMQVVYDKTGEQ